MDDETTLPPCPKCGSVHTYEDGALLICPECAHEWAPSSASETSDERVVRDSVGNVLVHGDTVVVVKTLQVKGASGPLKAGTKVKNIRLVDDGTDHDIDCKIDGFGAMKLKSSIVKKA